MLSFLIISSRFRYVKGFFEKKIYIKKKEKKIPNLIQYLSSKCNCLVNAYRLYECSKAGFTRHGLVFVLRELNEILNVA